MRRGAMAIGVVGPILLIIIIFAVIFGYLAFVILSDSQPFLRYLVAESIVFVLASMGDVYLTDALVKKHGPQVEANPKVRRMYETGNFLYSWLFMFSAVLLYLGLGWAGSLPVPYAPLASVLVGLALPLLASANLLRGSLAFQRYREGPGGLRA